jgi:hypothetical protein
MDKINIAQYVHLGRIPQNRDRDHELEVIVGTRPPQFVCCLVNLVVVIGRPKLMVQVTQKWGIDILSEALTLVLHHQDDIIRAFQELRAAPPQIDLSLLSAHVMVLLDCQDGLTADEAASRLAAKDRYAGYPAGYLVESVRSLLEQSVSDDQIRREGDRYIAYPPVSILQDTPARPEEYLPPEIFGRNTP